MTNTFSREALLATLPPPLAEDPTCYALAYAIADAMEQFYGATVAAMLYPRIDELDGPMLDQIAKDFRVVWWNENASLAEKRQALKDSWSVHRHLATPYAVETAIKTYFGPEGELQEWYDTDDLGPGWYRLVLRGAYAPQTPQQEADFRAKLAAATRLSSFAEILVDFNNVPPIEF